MSATDTLALLGPNFITTFQTEMDLIINPLRKHIAMGRPLSMGKELWEYVVSDSIQGGTWCGAGKNIVDVNVGNDIGIDVKSVSKNEGGSGTTEASMYQNFDDGTGILFEVQDKQGLWSRFVDGWINKVKSVKEYYLIGIIREKETLDCSICCFKVTHTDLPYNTINCSFSKKGKSLHVSGIADPDFIQTSVYSSKTRLEIRFKKKVWEDPEYCLPIYKF